VLLLGEVLTSLAPSGEFFSVAQSCGPVESSSESLADQRARGRVVAADALVDLFQDVLAFLPGDALHEYSRRCAPLVKLVSDEDIGLGTADELLKAAMHPVSFWTSLMHVGAFMLVMAEIFSGLASMPRWLMMKPSSLPEGTPKTHLFGLSF
jgi:hypothetical protein